VAAGQRRGTGELLIDGVPAAGPLDLTPTLVRLGGEGLDVGLDRRRKVSPRYADRGTFAYPGRIAFVRIVPGAQAPGSVANRPEAQAQAD
jgi:arylsulfatase